VVGLTSVPEGPVHLDTRHAWACPPGDLFLIRSSSYLQNRKKVTPTAFRSAVFLPREHFNELAFCSLNVSCASDPYVLCCLLLYQLLHGFRWVGGGMLLSRYGQVFAEGTPKGLLVR
jgi:hypothetical protein